MSNTADPIVEAIYKAFAEQHPWGPDLKYGFTEYVERIAPVAAANVIDALAKEERFIPVAESGERWAPRTREGAESAMLEWPAGGSYWTPDGSHDPYDGVTHIIREVRWGTEWVVAESIDTDSYPT